jgi:hypothetical protein
MQALKTCEAIPQQLNQRIVGRDAFKVFRRL